MDLRTAERTVILTSYLLLHAQAAFVSMGSDPVIAAAQKLRAYLGNLKSLKSIRQRDLHQQVKGRHPQLKLVADFEKALGVLEEHGYVRLVRDRSPGKPGRPKSPLVELNPIAFPEAQA